MGWWASLAQSVPIVLHQIGVGVVGLKLVVRQEAGHVLDEMVVVREGGAKGRQAQGRGERQRMERDMGPKRGRLRFLDTSNELQPFGGEEHEHLKGFCNKLQSTARTPKF